MDQETEQQEQQGPAPVAHRSKVPQIEVVNEIQILNRKDNNQRSLNNSKTKSKDKEKDKEKDKDSKHSDKRSKSSSKASNNDCGNNSKYKIKEPDPDETTKKAKSNEEDDTKKPSKKTSIGTTTITSTTVATPTNGTAEKATKHEKNNAGICVCGKLLKRVKGILDRTDKKVGKEQEEEDITVPVRYYPESLQALCKATRFSEEEIKRMYRGFKAECPNGLIKEENFKNIYSQFFPFGASSAQYAHYVFNSIDRSLNGTLSFEEFVLNLSILSRGTVEEKLNWTFQLYDVNGDGFITKNEMQEVITAVYELMGRIPEGCKEENQIKEKVENLFKKMDHNMDEKISLDEFMDSCRNDDSIRSSITVFQTIF